MKYMPALAAAAVDSQPSLESDDLSLEGFVDKATSVVKALKERFTPSNEEKLKAEVAAKLAILSKQRKVLDKSKSAVSTSRDDKTHQIKTKRISHSNFTASTAGEVLAGLQRNRKLVQGALLRLKSAKSKAEVQSIHDSLEAEFAKKGRIAEKIPATRSETIKILDESIALNEVSTKYCEMVGELSEIKMSNEGFGSTIANGLGMFLMIIVLIAAFVIGYLITIYIWAMIFMAPFIGIPLMVLWIGFLVFIGGDGDPDSQAAHLLRESR
jgi:hypothetical protein